jgi:hypothetical protein
MHRGFMFKDEPGKFMPAMMPGLTKDAYTARDVTR